jgi:hypothetical protein
VRFLAFSAAVVLLASSLSAQRVTSSVDVSGTGVWYADSIRATGTTVAPAIRVDWPSATLAASLAASRLGGGTSVQGAVAPSVFTPNVGPFSAELAGSFGGSTHRDGTKTGAGLGAARLYAVSSGSGAWAGVGLGATWDGSVWRRVRQTEAGVWIQRRGVTALATVNPVVVGDTLRYTDTQMAIRLPSRAFELGATGGVRGGMVGAEIGGTSRVWGSASATWWLAPRLALVANAGTYPTDFTQGFPGGRFVAFSLRLSSRRSTPAVASNASPETDTRRVDQAAMPGAATELAVAGTDARRTIRVRARGARSVEISGDFTRWQPHQLMRDADGWWTVSLPIARGTHQINVRIDGGAWVAPPGLLSAADEFGGVVGILVIE